MTFALKSQDKVHLFHFSTQRIMDSLKARKDKHVAVLGQSIVICATVPSLQQYEQAHDAKGRPGVRLPVPAQLINSYLNRAQPLHFLTSSMGIISITGGSRQSSSSESSTQRNDTSFTISSFSGI